MLFQLASKDLRKGSKRSRIAFWFVLFCVADVGWIFAWHYRQIAVSVLAMVALLFCLTRILTLIKTMADAAGMISLEMPFGLYAGWITVATVVNISAFLVSLGWDGFGVPLVWLVLVLLVAAVIAAFVTYRIQNIAYPAAVIWGFSGILTRYMPDFRFDLQTPAMWIVLTIALCLLALTAQWILLLARRVK